MTDQRSPNGPRVSEDADAIIELTDVVPSPESEDVIELTDIIPDDVTAENDIIELTDVVSPPVGGATQAAETPVDEPVIDLTEAVTGEEENDLSLSELEAVAEDDLDPLPNERGEASTSGDLEFAEMELDIEEDRKEDNLFDSLGMNMEADLLPTGEDDGGELDFNLSTQELSDAIDLLDAKLAEEPGSAPPPDEGRVGAPPSMGAEQFEAALENVIRKMLGEKIDRLLNDAIERTVSAEIARLKDQLLGEDSA